MSKELDVYNVTGRLVLIVSVPIHAKSFGEALVRGHELKETSFIKMLGEWVDGKVDIISVSKDDAWGLED